MGLRRGHRRDVGLGLCQQAAAGIAVGQVFFCAALFVGFENAEA